MIIATRLALAAVALAPAVWEFSPRPDTWTADLLVVDGDDHNVRNTGSSLVLKSPHRSSALFEGGEVSGHLTLQPHRLTTPAALVKAKVDATVPHGTSVAVEVRGHQGGHRWTEWHHAGSALSVAVRKIQVRVTLTGPLGHKGPVVRSIHLTATPVAPVAPAAPKPSPKSKPAVKQVTYRVFATEEGDVGGTTANGRTIVKNDHFVALPSRRGLSANGSGEYSVRVCVPKSLRCEYAPVWDVGPWNTKDDYWNAATRREQWSTLPQGKPESQAAFRDRYNGGKSQFGRKVLNPAGIDLADGTFLQGLKLTDNAWVNVTYLWMGEGPTGIISKRVPVRSGTTVKSPEVGIAAYAAHVPVECHLKGESVKGPLGTSAEWDRIGPGHYVPAAYVQPAHPRPVAPVC